MPNRYGSIMAPGYVAPTPWRDGLLRGLLDASPIGVLDMLQSVPLTPADAVWRAITPQRPALGDAIANRLGFGAPPADLGDYGSEYDSGRMTTGLGLLGGSGVLGAVSRAGRGLLGAVRQGQSVNSGGLLGGGVELVKLRVRSRANRRAFTTRNSFRRGHFKMTTRAGQPEAMEAAELRLISTGVLRPRPRSSQDDEWAAVWTRASQEARRTGSRVSLASIRAQLQEEARASAATSDGTATVPGN